MTPEDLAEIRARAEDWTLDSGVIRNDVDALLDALAAAQAPVKDYMIETLRKDLEAALAWQARAAKLLRAADNGFTGECGWTDEQEDEARAMVAALPEPPRDCQVWKLANGDNITLPSTEGGPLEGHGFH